MSRRPLSSLEFDAISIEGGLLPAEWLAKVALLDAPQQGTADYSLRKGLNLRDELGRYWRIAQAHWADFQAARRQSHDSQAISQRLIKGLLEDVFEATDIELLNAPELIAERIYPITARAAAGRLPLVVGPHDALLDARLPRFGDAGRQRSAFGLLQDYLNAADTALWGIASNGLLLRLVRDNASLTRPAWIEADLERIFGEDRFADFSLLWLLIHISRFGKSGQPPEHCALEAWREASREEGTRAREQLRGGVEASLLALGQGFLSRPENEALRAALARGELSSMAYFEQLLRLVYRLIFLLTIEERSLLHPPSSDPAAIELYRDAYALRRLRERARRRRAWDRHGDQWESLKPVWAGLAEGQPLLALPALGGLFGRDQCPHLDTAALGNADLLMTMFKLGWMQSDGSLVRINWRDMGPEEFGSVYESLLELVPEIAADGRQFRFAGMDQSKGNARKTSGSYYTPDSLVQELLDSALEPVVRARTQALTDPAAIEAALLSITVCDPACGSGHFLLGAARRIAQHLARVRSGGTPSGDDFRHALRDVISHCIFGVDLNPMAMELCKVALWMEAVDPGLPLTFLNSHIQQGNALLGTTPELMAKSIPDAAWEAFEGDDKKTASALKKRNKAEAGGQRTLDLAGGRNRAIESEAVARAVSELDATSDTSLEALAKKEKCWHGILGSPEYRHVKLVADAWCAAFVWSKQPGELADAAPTNEVWRQLRDGQSSAPALTTKTVGDLAEQYQFFHWQLQFPQVFAKGGFDIVLGNPPWERVSLKEKEWFAQRDPDVAGAATGALRLKRIADLERANPRLHRDFMSAKRVAAGEKNLLRRSGMFPLCGLGDVNTFAVFAELAKWLSRGRGGLVLPTGIVTADTTQDFVAALVKGEQLVSLFDFDNRSGMFPAVQGNVRFCLMTMTREPVNTIHGAAQLRGTNELRDPQKTWRLTQAEIRRLNPNTLTLPLFPSQRDADLVARIYSRLNCLDEIGAEYPGRWNIPMQRMLHMGDDSYLFQTDDDLRAAGYERQQARWLKGAAEDGNAYVALLEAKLCHQYNHRASTFDGILKTARFGTHPATRDLTVEELRDPTTFAEPRYWVPESEVRGRIGGRRYLLAFRDAVSAVADSRSLVATVVPPYGAGHTLLFFFPESAEEASFVCAWFNSFATDFVFRLKASGAHASFFLLRQLPIPRRDLISGATPWSSGGTVLDWIVPRVVELSYTAWSLSDFASDCGVDRPPFRWDEDRRFLLRCELDAMFFYLYEVARDEVEYILNTFQIVRRNDERDHGSYRTRDTILSIYDEMANSARTGKPYETRLDPPPADATIAHQTLDPALHSSYAPLG